MATTTRSTSSPASSHQETEHLAPEEIPARDMLYEEPFYDSRQTALLLGAMGLGFAGLVVLLLVIGFGG